MLAALEQYPDEWLLRADMLNIADDALKRRLADELCGIGQRDESLKELTALALDPEYPLAKSA